MMVRVRFTVGGVVTLDVPDDDPDTVSEVLSDWWYGNGDFEGTTYEDIWDAIQYDEPYLADIEQVD